MNNSVSLSFDSLSNFLAVSAHGPETKFTFILNTGCVCVSSLNKKLLFKNITLEDNGEYYTMRIQSPEEEIDVEFNFDYADYHRDRLTPRQIDRVITLQGASNEFGESTGELEIRYRPGW